MGCKCLCFFQGSKPWVAILAPAPILSAFASFFSGPGSLSLSITVSVILIMFSALYFYTFCKQKPVLVDISASKTVPRPENKIRPQENVQEKKALFDPLQSARDTVGPVANATTTTGKSAQGFLMESQDLYSESESMDQFSSEEEEGEEDQCSDMEWPYDIKRRIDCSDDSISDDESLIEIAIPTGHSLSPGKSYPEYNKLSALEDLTMFRKHSALDYYADFCEEENLIEIDIYMGSIKCPSFGI